MKSKLGKLLISILIPLGVGFLGSIFTISQIPTWYVQINKPSLVPPNWVFGPVWTTLYILMGIALYLIWQSKSKKDKRVPYFVFVVQLILNLLWSVFFFNNHWLFLSVVEIAFLWVMILINILKFRVISKTAAALLYPYLAWVTFASYLTVSVWLLN
jgi:tryptophan-rich sensory protein